MSILSDISKKSILNSSFIKKEKIELINKRYAYLEEIGRGGLSVVHKAIDIYSQYFEDKSNIVIKIPNKELLKKKDISALVYAEYSFLKRLNSDNIVKVLDFGIDRKTDVPFLVLEHIQGSLLSDVPWADINLKTKKQIFRVLQKTLYYIHQKNIIHADISPSNIILKDDFTPMIFDFGISQNIDNEDSFTLKHEKSKAFNPLYSPPELLLENNKKPTIYSDIFSLAVVFYEIFEEVPLFKESSNELLINPKRKIQFKNTPLFFKLWIKKALNVIPEKRAINNKFSYNFISF